ncbi:MAG: hypothetical protein ACFCUS_07005 [Rubrimonas sp.]|uniref:hypothetical protein n=1 Tax=Rubrimonas sp. TaxID=2036015 RepID=UPI002FDE206E
MISGGVAIFLRPQGEGVAARSQVEGAGAPERLFAGRTPEEAARLAGLVFNLCGAAQEGAARAAFGLPQRPDIGRRIALESLRHHALKLCVDWPEALGLDADRGALAHVGAQPDMDLLSRALFGAGGPPSDGAAFADWRARAATAPARALARLWAAWREDPAAGPDLWAPPEALAASAVDFARAEIDGRPVETGLAARMGAHPLMRAVAAETGRGALWRVAARLLDAARLIEALREGEGEVAPRALGPGLGVAQAARGTLIALGEAEGGRVRAFRTLTPTDCALHERGALAAAFAGLRSGGGLTLAVAGALALESVDPCMGARIEVEACEDA